MTDDDVVKRFSVSYGSRVIREDSCSQEIQDRGELRKGDWKEEQNVQVGSLSAVELQSSHSTIATYLAESFTQWMHQRLILPPKRWASVITEKLQLRTMDAVVDIEQGPW
jgi:hypothetical protein